MAATVRQFALGTVVLNDKKVADIRPSTASRSEYEVEQVTTFDGDDEHIDYHVNVPSNGKYDVPGLDVTEVVSGSDKVTRTPGAESFTVTGDADSDLYLWVGSSNPGTAYLGLESDVPTKGLVYKRAIASLPLTESYGGSGTPSFMLVTAHSKGTDPDPDAGRTVIGGSAYTYERSMRPGTVMFSPSENGQTGVYVKDLSVSVNGFPTVLKKPDGTNAAGTNGMVDLTGFKGKDVYIWMDERAENVVIGTEQQRQTSERRVVWEKKAYSVSTESSDGSVPVVPFVSGEIDVTYDIPEEIPFFVKTKTERQPSGAYSTTCKMFVPDGSLTFNGKPVRVSAVGGAHPTDHYVDVTDCKGGSVYLWIPYGSDAAYVGSESDIGGDAVRVQKTLCAISSDKPGDKGVDVTYFQKGAVDIGDRLSDVKVGPASEDATTLFEELPFKVASVRQKNAQTGVVVVTPWMYLPSGSSFVFDGDAIPVNGAGGVPAVNGYLNVSNLIGNDVYCWVVPAGGSAEIGLANQVPADSPLSFRVCSLGNVADDEIPVSQYVVGQVIVGAPEVKQAFHIVNNGDGEFDIENCVFREGRKLISATDKTVTVTASKVVVAKIDITTSGSSADLSIVTYDSIANVVTAQDSDVEHSYVPLYHIAKSTDSEGNDTYTVDVDYRNAVYSFKPHYI